MAEKFVNVRFGGGALDRLDALCEARGVSRSDVIRVLVLDAALEPEERDTIPDQVELLRLLSDKARAGNVTAIRTLLDRAASEARTPSEFDELDGISVLAAKRTNGTGHVQ